MRIVLTGAAGGIGSLVAHELVARDHDVVGLDRNEAGVATLPASVDTRAIDLTQPDAVAEELADVRADAVVACAGWYEIGALEDCSPERFRRHLDANLCTVHNVVHPLLSTLRSRNGRVVVVGSTTGSVPLPFHGGYSAAKAGVAGYVDALRRELIGHDVDASLIEPGPTATGLNERAAASLPPNRDERETSAYADAYRAFESYGPASVDPETVAETVVTATTTDDPQARYRVGPRARWLPRLGAVLPTALFDRIVRAGMPDGALGRWIDG